MGAPRRDLLVSDTHTFADLATAIDRGFARWDLSQEALLNEFVRSGNKEEAVAATSALCGYRLVNWGSAKSAELAAAGAVHVRGVDYWIRRDAKVGPAY